MKKILVALALMGAVLVAATGVAWAATVDCKVGVFCEGTDEPDELIGTNQRDVMSGLQDDDLLVGFRGADEMEGDNPQPGGDDTSTDGNDELIGYRGPDTLRGFGGSDYLRGGRGDDLIDATEESDNPGKDTVRGSRNQDFIDAVDGFKDTIFCGRGEDEVFFDEGLDVVADNCEIQNPRSYRARLPRRIVAGIALAQGASCKGKVFETLAILSAPFAKGRVEKSPAASTIAPTLATIATSRIPQMGDV